MENTAERDYAGAGLRVSAVAQTAMGELLAMLTIPPLVGLVAYYVFQRTWEREENRPIEGHEQRDNAALDENVRPPTVAAPLSSKQR
jgi:uncharacterized membrane protein